MKKVLCLVLAFSLMMGFTVMARAEDDNDALEFDTEVISAFGTMPLSLWFDKSPQRALFTVFLTLDLMKSDIAKDIGFDEAAKTFIWNDTYVGNDEDKILIVGGYADDIIYLISFEPTTNKAWASYEKTTDASSNKVKQIMESMCSKGVEKNSSTYIENAVLGLADSSK